MADIIPVIEKLACARTRCTFTIAATERSALEHGTLERMAKKSHVKGFRTGHAPLEIIKAQTKPEALTEEIVHAFLRERLPKLLQEQKLTPVMHPKVELTSHTPITLSITIVEKPTVTFRGKDALRIAKKDISITDAEITNTLDTLKKEHAIPEWTDAVVQKQWSIPSLEKLRASIADALKRQKEHAEQRRREEAFRKKNAITSLRSMPPAMKGESASTGNDACRNSLRCSSSKVAPHPSPLPPFGLPFRV